jgi:hypothetical protein
VVVNSFPSGSFQWLVGFVVVAGEHDHASNFKQTRNEFLVVLLREFVTVSATDPSVDVIGRVNIEQRFPCVEPSDDLSPIVALDLDILQSAMHGRKTINSFAPTLHGGCHSPLRICRAIAQILAFSARRLALAHQETPGSFN